MHRIISQKQLVLSSILIICSIILALIVANWGIVVAVAFLGLCVGAILFIGSFQSVSFGIYAIFGMAFFIMSTHRFYDLGDIPIAVIMEILAVATFLGILIEIKNNDNYKFTYTAVNVLLIIWAVYHLFQLANPNAASRIAWFYAVRNMFLIVAFYFIVCYGIKSKKFVSNIIKFWIFLVFLAALYCLKQEYFGFFEFENRWIYADRERLNLLRTWGKIRNFSFFEGPMTLGITLAYTSVLCITLIGGPFKLKNKVLLGIAGVIMIIAMLSTGTRTASVLLPCGFLFYALLTFRKQIIALVAIGFVFGTVLVFMPTSNPNLYIMRTAFRGEEDASMNVRLTNQELIQPYIKSFPFGSGVGSTGGWGTIFSPHTFIGKFPPDSEYVRIAIELGWIGLLYFCILLFFILKMGIDHYFRARDPKIKAYYASVLTVTFMTVIAMYPQEAIRVHPTGVLFALCVALLAKMHTVQDTIKQ